MRFGTDCRLSLGSLFPHAHPTSAEVESTDLPPAAEGKLLNGSIQSPFDSYSKALGSKKGSLVGLGQPLATLALLASISTREQGDKIGIEPGRDYMIFWVRILTSQDTSKFSVL